jgi:hypothetical protein
MEPRRKPRAACTVHVITVVFIFVVGGLGVEDQQNGLKQRDSFLQSWVKSGSLTN